MTDKINQVLELETQLKQTIDYVRDCEARISKGEIMDMNGLDNNVVVICDAIAKLPENEASDMQDKMEILIKGLEGLAVTIKEHQETDQV